ncbi:hypothetical protein CK203_071031 [Vitis vinifera]|uniref:Uncharacterized protein n=1 Tax=Vitis vinifera TaxID=29760 RepID=A0A438EA74_VITVI|nr:hypothetical protein CK203_071031 [Vitis vinifera]
MEQRNHKRNKNVLSLPPPPFPSNTHRALDYSNMTCYFSHITDFYTNLTMKRLRGYEIKAKHWDSFYKFYRNTTDNKWGSPYLTRDFFHNMGSKMEDQVLLVVAEKGMNLLQELSILLEGILYSAAYGMSPTSLLS